MWIRELVFIGDVRRAFFGLAMCLIAFSGIQIARNGPDLKELIDAVQSGNELDCEKALIEIERIGPDASPAIPALCSVLNSPNYSIRGLAVDALVAIGNPSVESLQGMLESGSSFVRAAALQALGRLNAITPDKMSHLKDDTDPRVRASLAIGLASCDQVDASLILIGLLKDDEPAVSVQACLAIRQQLYDPEIIVPELIQSLSRPETASVAVDTLSAYGIDAQPAIPQLLSILGAKRLSSYSSRDVVESALEHIGPPAVADVESISSLLDANDHERTILVADALSLLGTKGEAASEQLIRVIDELIVHSIETSRKYADDESDEGYVYDDSGRVNVAVERCLAAYWRVSRNPDRFVDLVEKFSTECESSLGFIYPSPWNDFTKADMGAFDRLMESTNPDVLNSALSAISELGPSTTHYFDRVVELLEDKSNPESRYLEFTLASMGPEVSAKSIPALVRSYEKGMTTIYSFANAIETIGTGTDESRAILVRGLEFNDEWTAAGCAAVLCRISTDPENDASLVLKTVSRHHCTSRQAIRALRKLPSIPDPAREFVIECLSDDDLWTRHDAVIVLGEIGPESNVAIDAIKPMLMSQYLEERLQAAKALYLITDDDKSFDQFIKNEFEKKDARIWELGKVIEAIGELGIRGAKFQHYLIENRKLFEAQQVKVLCNALEKIGSDEAVKTLEIIATSKDWEAISAAKSALEDVKQANTPGVSK